MVKSAMSGGRGAGDSGSQGCGHDRAYRGAQHGSASQGVIHSGTLDGGWFTTVVVLVLHTKLVIETVI